MITNNTADLAAMRIAASWDYMQAEEDSNADILYVKMAYTYFRCCTNSIEAVVIAFWSMDMVASIAQD
jgi:hypothetical protein